MLWVSHPLVCQDRPEDVKTVVEEAKALAGPHTELLAGW